MTTQTTNSKNESKTIKPAAPAIVGVPAGYENIKDVSDTSCRGWYKPGVCGVLYGVISGTFLKQNTDAKTGEVKTQTFVKITVATEYECVAADPETEKITRTISEETRIMKLFIAQPGDTIGVKVRSKCEKLLDYEVGAKVRLEALNKTSIRGGAQSMWNFKLAIDGKEKAIPHSKNTPHTSDEDDDIDI